MTTTATATRQTRRFEEKRELILGAAASLFNRHGVRGTTLADVAARVGLVTNSISYYYRRKEDLAAACALRAVETIADVAERAAHAPDMAERVRLFTRLYFDVLADIAAGRRAELLSSNDLRALEEPHAATIFAAYTEMFRAIRRLLDGAGAPDLERDDRNARALLLVSVVHAAHNWIRRYEPEDFPRAAERTADILLNGLSPSGAAFAPLDLGLDARVRPASGDAADERFLRAASFMINEQGYRGASVDKISARLSVTKGSFYHHNEHKDDLVAACFERTFALIRAAQFAAIEAAPDGWTRAASAANALVAFQLSSRGPLLRIAALAAMPEATRPAMVQQLDRLLQRFVAIVSDGIADGSIRAVDARIAGQLLYMLTNSAAELHRWVPVDDPQEAARRFARPLFTGLSRA
ncbi:TetR/AcrR family transcriptional regulator [Aureimonas mangrovi]|uniref:TetR/AcrR family transcriptional regulator n=1 Tax=Aureimonas mangrovi TaxID=2758041 RepID=UPI00163D983D|nr:TetR/AcrR family transcriptional regulator [Aureimonas mangrovi]